MDVAIHTYEDRFEIDVPLKEPIDLDGGGELWDVGTAKKPEYVARYVFGRGGTVVDEDVVPSEIDAQACAEEAVRLVIASTPGPGLEHLEEQPASTEKVQVDVGTL